MGIGVNEKRMGLFISMRLIFTIATDIGKYTTDMYRLAEF
jgi:hypothetical protein